MPKLNKLLLILLVPSIFSWAAVDAQVLNSLYGRVSGQVKDSTNLVNIPHSTVAIYNALDESLIKYRLTDLKGRFTLDSLPVDKQLLLVVTYVGFNSFVAKFLIDSKSQEKLFEKILLSNSSTLLKEVVIKMPPPMIMRGDTVEFNADAFKTEQNSVVGDLIKKLPGFVIWGDGRITVNGKSVSQVLVDGKTFFSNDHRIMSENLPKEIVDKVQIIPDKQITNRSDSLTNSVTMNVTLKEGHKSGLFGKVGTGYGTESRYDGDFTMAGYTPKHQFAATSSRNNINKDAYSVSQMMANTSFKNFSPGNNLMNSKFNQRGITVTKSHGSLINSEWSKKIRSTLNYVDTDADNTYEESYTSNILLRDSSLVRSLSRASQNIQGRKTLNGSINLNDLKANSLNINASYNRSNSNVKLSESSQTANSRGGLLNTFFINDEVSNKDSKNSISFDFNHNVKSSRNRLPSKEDFRIIYSFNKLINFSDRIITNSYTSSKPDSTLFNRKFDNDYSQNGHRFFAEYKSMAWLLGFKNSRTNINMQNDLYVDKDKKVSIVDDINQNSGEYTVRNFYNSNITRFNSIMEKPTISISQRFETMRAGKNSKVVDIALIGKSQIILQNNVSIKEFQNIEKKYVNFMPDFRISFATKRTGIETHKLDFRAFTETGFPTMDQLIPLIDSLRQTHIFLGNRNLKAFTDKSAIITYRWFQEKANLFDITTVIKAGKIDGFISDSTYYDTQGRGVTTPININKLSYMGINSDLLKAQKVGSLQLTYQFHASYSRRMRPTYLNGTYRTSTTNISSITSQVMLNTSNLSGLVNIWFRNYSLQLNDDLKFFNNNNFGGNIDLSLKLTKKVSISTSTSLARNEGNGSRNLNSIILNFSAAKRFAKNDQFELKFSANDLLNQNVGFVNRVEENIITTGSVSRLQRFFLGSLSYYPRFFNMK